MYLYLRHCLPHVYLRHLPAKFNFVCGKSFNFKFFFELKMEKKPRFRAPNFTSSDYILLCDIVSKYRHVIENKKNDGANLHQKQKAWLEVMKEYNSRTSGFTRTVESLQQTYKNLKKRLKKKASYSKMDIPGGGPPPNIDNDPELEKVEVLVEPVIDGIYSLYDGDSSSIMASQHFPPIEAEKMELVPDSLVWYTDGFKMESGTGAGIYAKGNKCSKSLGKIATVFQAETYAIITCAQEKIDRETGGKQRLEFEASAQETVSEKKKNLATAKMELVDLQTQLLRTQLDNEKEKLEHNRTLRAMEMEEIKRKYEHNEKIRILELETFNVNK